MQIFKKIVFILLIAGSLLYFWRANIIRAQDEDADDLEFSVDGGRIYFFQPETGRIFVYQANTNRFSRLLTLEKLGESLKQSRSVSIIEEEIEEEKEEEE